MCNSAFLESLLIAVYILLYSSRCYYIILARQWGMSVYTLPLVIEPGQSLIIPRLLRLVQPNFVYIVLHAYICRRYINPHQVDCLK